MAFVLLAAAAWIGIRAVLARAELEAAVPIVESLREAGASADSEAIERHVAELREHAGSASSLTSDIVWRAAEWTPGLGVNLSVVRELASTVEQISDGALGQLAEVAGQVQLDSLRPHDGTIDLAPLQAAAPTLTGAVAVLDRSLETLDTLDTRGAIAPVIDAHRRLGEAVSEARATVDAIERMAVLAPAMTGADGPRNLLVLFQNLAEARATGGIVGAAALIHADGGRLEFVKQFSAGDFGRFDESVLELPLDTRGLYGELPGQYVQDVTLTPRFPLSAELAVAMWQRASGERIDSVISVDPVALGYFLGASGPVRLPTGDEMNENNAVDLLLRDVYSRFQDPGDQDDFFGAASAAVFSHVLTGNVDPARLVEAFSRAGEERRLLMWSAHPDEQERIAETTLAGDLPVSDDSRKFFGIYLNDSTGGKVQYYLDTRSAVGSRACRNDGRATLGLEITLTSTAPADAATSLPRYVVGRGEHGVAPGDIGTIVSIYGPPGSIYVDSASSAPDFSMLTASDGEYPVVRFEIVLPPGESETIRLEMLSGAPYKGDVGIIQTPGVNRSVTEQLSLACEFALW